MAKKIKKSGISVNLSGVETSGRLVKEGTYLVKIDEVKLEESRSGHPMLKMVYKVLEGAFKGSKLFDNISLQPQALFKLKALMVSCGFEIPEGEFDFDPSDLLDLELSVEVAHESYEGKKRAKITDYLFPEDSDSEDDDEDEDEEEEDDEDEEEDEDGEDDEEIDYESMSLKELKALAKEKGIKLEKGIKKNAIIELLTDDEDEEDEEDEDEEIDYSELSTKELKALCKERGIKTKGMDDDDMIEALEEDDEE